MKTTVEITDELFREAKRYAVKHDLSFRQVVEGGLRQLLARQESPRKTFRLKKCSFKGQGMAKDYTWPEIRSQIYEGRGG